MPMVRPHSSPCLGQATHKGRRGNKQTDLSFAFLIGGSFTPARVGFGVEEGLALPLPKNSKKHRRSPKGGGLLPVSEFRI